MTTTYLGAASGTIASTGGSGWYQVQLTAGTQYVFDAGNGTLSDTQVTLYDSSGNVLATGSQNAAFNNESETSFIPTATGSYYIGVSSPSGGTGTYYVQDSTVSYGVTGNVNTTGSLSVGGQVTANITASGASAWYKVSLTAGTEYVFTLSGGTLSSPGLSFYDSSGHAIATSTQLAGTSAFEPSASGTYYVGVSSQSPVGGGTVTLSETTAVPDYLGITQTAGSVTVGGGAVSGNLATPGQADWFKVSLTANTQYVFDVVGSATLTAPGVALYDSTGKLLVPQTINGGPATSDSRTSFTPTTSGSYFVEASAPLGETGSFTVAVTTGANGAIGNINTTASLSVGGSATGNIAVAGESDFYKVTLTAGTEYVFDVTPGTGLANAAVTLYNSSGTALIAGAGGGPNGAAETSYDPQTGGTYYVAASGPIGSTGAYTISAATATAIPADNVTTTATLGIGGTVSGSFAHAGESSWYKLSLTAGSLYVISATPGTLADPEVVIYDSNGNQLTTGTAGGPNGGGQAVWAPTSTGTYYAAVLSQSSNIGSYSLSAAKATIGQLSSSLLAPVASGQPGTQVFAEGQSVSVTLPAFTDPNGLPLTYSATLTGGQALPSWLTFDPTSQTLSGVAPATAQSLAITVTATDSASLSATESLSLQIVSSGTAGASQEITSFVSQENSLNGRGANGINLDYNAAVGASPGASLGSITPPSGQNAVIGFESASFHGGYDAVILDGARSSYAIQVSNTGVTTIKDIGAGDATFGQTVTVSGESYIIFNGAHLSTSDPSSVAAVTTPPGSASGVLNYPNDLYYVLSPANAQLAQFYNALEPWEPQPSLGGFEYWVNQLANGMSLTSIAQSFINTSYFQQTFGDPGSTHTQHLAYVQLLYQHILGMTLGATNGGVEYWTNQMDTGALTGATTLISFTNATATSATINAIGGSTAGGGAGWLIDPTITGGYADPGAQTAASTVLSQAASTGYYNLSLVDPSTVTNSGVSANGITLTPGAVQVASSVSTGMIVLSSSFTQATIAGSGVNIHDGPGTDTITITGNNNTVFVGTSTSDTLTLSGGTNTTVAGFVAGSGSVLAVSGTVNSTGVTLLDGTSTPVQGSSLSFGTVNGATAYVVNIGTIGGGTAAEVVTAANKAYQMAGIAGNATTGALGEHVIFIGTETSGDTEIWALHAPLTSMTVNGQTVQVPINSPDLNGTHQITAAEITQIATLLGVAATTLSAPDLA